MSRFLISTNLQLLEVINNRINEYMKAKDTKYNAIQWGKITKHQTENKYTLDLGRSDDERNPFGNLSKLEKLDMIDELPDGWLPEKTSF